jgi:AcrR family transcriptional regulator
VTTTRTGRANPTYYGGDLRRDLLDAALELIAREGPSAVSLRSLARRLGVSHAAPANHFPDKAALFTAIAVEGFELLAAAIEEGTRRLGPDASAGQRLRAAGQAYMGFALAHRAHFDVMWQRDLLHQDDPELATAADATFALLLGGVRDVQAEGWAAGTEPQIVAYLAWSVVHGLATLWLDGPLQQLARRPFDEIAGEVAGLLGSALAPPHLHPRLLKETPCTPTTSTRAGRSSDPPTPTCASAMPSAAGWSTSSPSTTPPAGSPSQSSRTGSGRP